MIYGYARVSTDGQTLDAQREALSAAGAEKVFAETVSGARSDRAQLARLIKAANAGDTVLVTRLDRLARSTRDLLNILGTLAERGVAVPTTVWTEHPTRAQLDQVFDETGAEELIVKPAVSGGAWKTQRVRRGAAFEETAGVAMLVQPYLPTIESEGETSLLYFGGRLSHVVNKRPVDGDFRVQEEFGGRYTLLASPPVGAVALAGQVLDAVGEPLLYARIDVVPDADGRWLLMEAELIEPDFYLGVDPSQGGGFARALREAIDEGVPA